MTFLFLIILFILLIFILVFFDYRLGRQKHLRYAQKLESPLLYGEFEIFVKGKELFVDYFQSLQQAQKSIEIMFYIVRNDSFSQEFISILKNKAAEGVEVRLLLDQIGSLKFSKKMKAGLKKSGVKFQFCSRVKFPFLFYRSQIRNHRKITIIDGRTAYLGGFNVGKEYIDFDPKLSPWRDYHLKMTGEGVSFLRDVFSRDWQEEAGHEELPDFPKAFRPKWEGAVFADSMEGPLTREEKVLVRGAGPVLRDSGTAPALFERSAGRTAVLNGESQTNVSLSHKDKAIHEAAAGTSAPSKQRVVHQLIATEANLLQSIYLHLIQTAKKSIFIGTPYFIPSREILEELLKALKRGVKLTILVPATADHILVQEASYRYFRVLLSKGAEVYQFKNGFYHAKTIMIDENICDIGTANFDKRSLFLNKEINCYFYGEEFKNRLMEIIRQDIQDSQPLLLSELNKPNFFRAVKERAALAISFFL